MLFLANLTRDSPHSEWYITYVTQGYTKQSEHEPLAAYWPRIAPDEQLAASTISVWMCVWMWQELQSASSGLVWSNAIEMHVH